jgi:hypothetical protein
MSSEGLVLALDYVGEDLDIEGETLEPLGLKGSISPILGLRHR